MTINYVKIAVRNLLHNKLFSVINIAGLAVGTETFLLIFLHCWNALHYDNFYSDQHRLFRIIQRDPEESKGTVV
jgi:putative ABC transport system permease protein